MDERLEAGRHHLLNGDRALHMGYRDESRAHFESALLQFRGPELRLGEAHALRGLASVELASGHVELAEQRANEAVEAYQGLQRTLVRIDEEGASDDIRRKATEGEASARVLLGDLLVRRGLLGPAVEALRSALQLFAEIGEPNAAAAAWTSLGRIAMRRGELHEARARLEKALKIHRAEGDLSGEVGAQLTLAELYRQRREVKAAEQVLLEARPAAVKVGSAMLEGRVEAALGALMVQAHRYEDAVQHYEDALPMIRAATDTEMEGFALLGLGDAQSRLGFDGAVDRLVEGARLLASVDQAHGLAGALLRIAEHALRNRQSGLALAAAEGARRLWLGTDPVRGVSMALRMVVKSLAGMRRWRAVLSASVYRASVHGDEQGNAQAVATYYRTRMPKDWLDEVDALDADGIRDDAEQRIADALSPVLDHLGIAASALSSQSGALAVAEALALHVTDADSLLEQARPGEEAAALLHVEHGELGGDDAPDEEGGYAGLYEAPKAGSDDTPTPHRTLVPGPERVGAHPDDAPTELAPGYEGFYDAPAVGEEEE